MVYRRRRYWLPGTLLFLLAATSFAEEPAATESSVHSRPRVGLVLGGGGARGAAHIGVLKELERMRIPIDAIAGTSMGAIVGGLYATGISADELESMVGSLDWGGTLSDEPDRKDLSFRRKQDDAQATIDLELGLRGTHFVLPKGAIHGQKLDMLLRDLTLNASQVQDFDELPIPFRAIASDVERGEAYVMSKGDLAKSIRASMSVPAALSPVEIDGHLLVDGGLVGNLPINVMQSMDVDVVIAVDVEFPLYKREELESVLTISEQMLTILIRKETVRQIERLADDDVLIRPDLGTYASTNFADVLELIEPGQAATRRQVDKLAGLALDESAWQAHLAARRHLPESPSHLAFVRVVHDGKLSPRVLEASLDVKAGDPIDHTVLARNADYLYGLGLYEQVSYSLVEEGGETGVEYRARTKSWGPNVLQFAVSLEDDFEGSTSFNLAARMTRAGINRLGAEWRTDVQVGTDPTLFSEFYQPLSFDSRFFIAPRLGAQQSNFNTFELDETVARYRLSEAQVGLDFGRELGRVGEFRVGVFRGFGDAHVKVGDPSLSNFDFQTGGAFLRLRIDTRDSAYFTRSGLYGDIQWTFSRPGLGADEDLDRIESELARTWSRGNNSLQLGLNYATTLRSNDSVQDYFPLGGFLRLSGLERGEIRGPHAGLGRAVFYRRIGKPSGLLDTPFYVGLSAEAGNVWQSRSEMSFGSLRLSGSVFAGLDTLIGPVYLAAGFAEQGQSNFYLVVGDRRARQRN